MVNNNKIKHGGNKEPAEPARCSDGAMPGIECNAGPEWHVDAMLDGVVRTESVEPN